MNGKGLARADKVLRKACDALKVPQLTTFFSLRPSDRDVISGAKSTLADQLADLNQLRARLGRKPSKLGKSLDALSKLAVGLRRAGTTRIEEQWFSPADGLRTVRALLEHLDENPRSFKGDEVDPAAIEEDLEAIEQIISAAQKAGVRFHLSIDY